MIRDVAFLLIGVRTKDDKPALIASLKTTKPITITPRYTEPPPHLTIGETLVPMQIDHIELLVRLKHYAFELAGNSWPSLLRSLISHWSGDDDDGDLTPLRELLDDRGEIERLQSQRQAVLDLHREHGPTRNGIHCCQADLDTWPCATVRALTVEVRDGQ